MIFQMPCEYCGKETPCDLNCLTPPCCHECIWIPRLVVLVSVVGIVGLLIAAVITYGVH